MPDQRLDHRADHRVLVIGSGIAGAGTAFALARRGAAVTIIDAADTGQATAASAGIILPWATATHGAFYDLYAAGAAFYPELLDRLADLGITRTDYRRVGGLIVNADDAKLAATYETLLQRRKTAPEIGDVERLDNTAVRDLFPPLAEGLNGVWISGGGRVDGRTLRDALLAAAERLGVRRLTGRAVLDDSGPRVTLDGQTLQADAVVVAAGAWTNQVLEPLRLRVPVEPQKGQITQLRIRADTSNWPTVHPIGPHYLVAFDEGRLAVGATRERGSGFDTRVTAAGQLQVLQEALSLAPGLADATLIETRVGLRPLAGDLPVAGPLPGRDGVFVATGYGAGGLTMGPRIGDAIARLVLGEPAPELDAVRPTVTDDDPATLVPAGR